MKKMLMFVATVLFCGMSFAVTSPDYSGGVPADQTDDFHGGGGVSPGDNHGGGVPADETDDTHENGGVPADTPTPLPDGGPYAETVDGIEWTFMVKNGEASVGMGSSSGRAIPWSTTGAILIPSMLGDCPVTSIEDCAFWGRNGLTSVMIPSSVTGIGNRAFFRCGGLKSVTISLSVTNIGDRAFSGCSGLTAFVVDSQNPNYQSVDGLLLTKDGTKLIAGVNGDVVIPSSVTSIGESTFGECSGLTSVTIPEGVTSICDYAFYYCSGLKSVAIPSSVTSIVRGAFYGCSGMISFVVDSQNPNYQSVNGLLLSKDGKNLLAGVNGDVVIPSSVTSINGYTFMHCSGLTSVMIPSSVTYIGYMAFAYCSGLKSVTIPSSVADIALEAFEGCSGLKAFVVDSQNPNYQSVDGLLLTKDGTKLIAGVNGDVVIPPSVTSIGKRAFEGLSGLTSVTIPDGVTSIGLLTFEGCSGLKSVTIPSSVTSIGQGAFGGCSGLESVTIPSSVTNIGYQAFFWCSGLTNVTIPSSVTSIGEYAFDYCRGLNAVDFEGAPPKGIASASIKTDAAIRYNVEHEEEWLPVIEECGFTNASSYVSPKYDGGPYTEVVDGVEWTFMVANSKAKVESIPKSSAGDISIPLKLGGRIVTELGIGSFQECENLKSITIPASVIFIGRLAFCNCNQLKDVYFDGDTCPILQSGATGNTPPFNACNWDLIMHVPATWKGRGKTLCGYTVVRDGEEDGVIAANLTVTNVVVHYVLNSVQPEIAVPVSGDTGFTTIITEVKSAGAVSVPSEWKDNYPAFESKFGTNFGKALMWKTGKKDGANNDMFVWQDFVAGTDPTNPDDKFTASITMVDGVPVISYTPELSDEQKALREYKTFGKKQLQDKDWTDITDLEGEAKKPYNFFKVTVEMK